MKPQLYLLFKVWCFLELFYQFQLRLKWTRHGEYQWECYAVKRNEQALLQIQDYFTKEYSHRNFYYGTDTILNPLSELPLPVQMSIRQLQHDLLNGLQLFQSKQDFSIQYLADSVKYSLWIHAGYRFRSDFNGYNLFVTMSNVPTVDEIQVLPNLYVNAQSNQEYRWFPILLSYNCNRYDLLIWKVLDPLVQLLGT